METILAGIVLLLIAVGAMAIGVIAGRKPIAGSCGGMGAIGMDKACEVCGGDKNKCDNESADAAAVSDAGDFYDATKR